MNSVQSTIEYSVLICPNNIQVEPFRKSKLEIVDPSDINDLLKKIAEGNHTAFTIFYHRHAPLIPKYLNHLGYRNKHLQEDIIQEVFLLLWSKKEKWERVTDFESYLFIMVRNMLRAEIRKTKRRLRIMNQIISLENLLDVSYVETMDCQERKRICQKGIDLLPRQTKTVCQLNQKGMKIKEIAMTLGISRNTVKNHRQDGIKKLKEWLAQHIN